MTLIAHAVAYAPPTPVDGAGLRGRPLAWSEAGSLGLWSTEWDAGLALDRADAMAHHGLVERICATQPCLPVRFGTAFASAAAARASLEKRDAELRTALERVAGKCELALTLLWATDSQDSASRPAALPPDAGPGRRFLEDRRARLAERAERRRRATHLVDRLVAELAIDRALVWHEICTTDSVAVSLAVLVPTEGAVGQKARLEALASQLGDVVAVVNGPWPPYSFARIDS